MTNTSISYSPEPKWRKLTDLNDRINIVGGQSNFTQQNLRSWHPILTVGTALPYFWIAMFIHIILALFCFFMNFQVNEYQFEYTDCFQHGNDGVRCSEIIANDSNARCQCHVDFKLDFIPNDVYIYYGLENLYQNYMSYVRSIDFRQMNGQLDKRPPKRCLDKKSRKLIVPCGAVANSLFNDTFELKQIILAYNKNKNKNKIRKQSKEPRLKPYLYPITIQRKGISFKQYQLFRNPPLTSDHPTLESWFNGTLKPSNWPKPVYELDPEDPDNNGFQNEPLIIWMRVAPFSTFRKVYGKVVHKNNSLVTAQGLLAGNYMMIINYSYPVEQFNGRKFIIISNVSPLGGKNYFLAYLFAGTVCAESVIIIFFYYLDKKYGKISKQLYVYIRKYDKKPYKKAPHMDKTPEEVAAIIERELSSKLVPVLRRKKLRKIPKRLRKAKKKMERKSSSPQSMIIKSLKKFDFRKPKSL